MTLYEREIIDSVLNNFKSKLEAARSETDFKTLFNCFDIFFSNINPYSSYLPQLDFYIIQANHQLLMQRHYTAMVSGARLHP